MIFVRHALVRYTGFEQHRVEVGIEDFVNVPVPNGEAGNNPFYFGDAQLVPESRAVDAGLLLPNINDDFKGSAPDLGAYEQGNAIPWYGPRRAGVR
jgi:hypothetical protein